MRRLREHTWQHRGLVIKGQYMRVDGNASFNCWHHDDRQYKHESEYDERRTPNLVHVEFEHGELEHDDFESKSSRPYPGPPSPS
ncbi:hypothetical protein E4U50_002064 [Claviceps purpurea]|nr:hypothetical protein E4U27_003122 [Claviceps purpurea]KAG6218097.1 hypothetical protein E4U50_002064 [Claviceps purpurea]